jgi:TusE/DsrC/DsvC family sulfur relay protein
MAHLKVGDATLELGDDGFMREPDRWNDEVAVALAATDGIAELTAKHWKVVRYIRAHYAEHHVPPLVRKLCKQTGLQLLEIYELFPKGPAKGACKVAGLPSPDGCV